MSSIDKGVISVANKIDSRVRVTNANGRIVGRINGQVVFDIADRYGYLHDDEAERVRNGINAYLYNENAERRMEEERRRREEEARRRAEEERRRREEEERRRRLEEQRQKAIASSRVMIAEKRNEVEAYFNRLNPNVNTGFTVPDEINEMLDIKQLINATESEIQKNQHSATEQIRHAKESILKMLDSTSSSLASSANADMASRMGAQAKNIKYGFDIDSVHNKNSEIVSSLNKMIKECGVVLNQVKEAHKKYNNETTASLLHRIKIVPIKTTKDLQKVISMLNESLATIADEKERAALYKAIEELNNANNNLLNLHLKSDVENGSQYEIPSFENEITQMKNKMIAIRENLISAKYTSLSTAQLEEVEAYVSDTSNGEVIFKKGEEIINRLEKVVLQDQRLKPMYDAFIKAREEAINMGVEVDMDFDVEHSESQLDQICDLIASKQIEEEKEEMWNRISATHALMDGLEWDLLGEKEEEGIVSFIYAKKGLDGVVMQVNATGETIRRRLIGVKVNGKETSIEAVKEAARKLEADNEPLRFMEGYKAIFPDTELGEDFGLADDPNIDEVIKSHGVFDLDEENKADEFHSITGEDVKMVSLTGKIKYVESHSQSYTSMLKNDSSQHRQKKAAANKVRYQHL